jgi:uncharacterized protein
MGLAHRSGALAAQPVSQDPGLALHYLSLAAHRCLAEADYEIANTLFWGSDDGGEALRQYGRHAYMHARRAAEDAWPEAYLLVGMAYEDGVGVRKDERTAVTWYLQGASKGDRFAQKKYEQLRNRGVEAFRKR